MLEGDKSTFSNFEREQKKNHFHMKSQSTGLSEHMFECMKAKD